MLHLHDDLTAFCFVIALIIETYLGPSGLLRPMLGYACLGYGALWNVGRGGETFLKNDPQTVTGDFNISFSLQYKSPVSIA